MPNNEEVLFSESNRIGFIQLNRTKAINSLNLGMVQSIYKKLLHWKDSPQVQAIVVYGEGERGFCAGGDVKTVCLQLQESPSYAHEFFYYEYLADNLLFHYPKPTICIGHGIVMGGGMGLFMACDYRITTPCTKIAMPESLIGFFPDVGASYFLNQLKNHWGYLLGLTGLTITGDEAYEIGLSNHNSKFTKAELLALISSSNDPQQLEQNLTSSARPKLQNFSDMNQVVDDIFSRPSLEEIKRSLHQENHSLFIKRARESFDIGSPTSHQVIFQQLREAKNWTRLESSWKEWRLATEMIHLDDFKEGIRAQLIDKDRNPTWSNLSKEITDDLKSLFDFTKKNPVQDQLQKQ